MTRQAALMAHRRHELGESWASIARTLGIRYYRTVSRRALLEASR